MANQRIRRKWRKRHMGELKRVHVSAEWARAHFPRILQRLKRRNEAYVISVEGAEPVCFIPYRWHRASAGRPGLVSA